MADIINNENAVEASEVNVSSEIEIRRAKLENLIETGQIPGGDGNIETAAGIPVYTKDYIDESRSNHINILNPNINESGKSYIVTEKGILYPVFFSNTLLKDLFTILFLYSKFTNTLPL